MAKTIKITPTSKDFGNVQIKSCGSLQDFLVESTGTNYVDDVVTLANATLTNETDFEITSTFNNDSISPELIFESGNWYIDDNGYLSTAIETWKAGLGDGNQLAINIQQSDTFEVTRIANPSAMIPRSHHGCGILNGDLHVFGGETTGTTLITSSSEVALKSAYPGDLATWTPVTLYPDGTESLRPYNQYGLISNVLISAGGAVGVSYTVSNVVKEHLVSGSSWLSGSALPEPRRSAFSIVYNNELYILGGASPSRTNSVFKATFDGSLISWSTVRSDGAVNGFTPVNSAVGLADLNGHFWVFCGSADSGRINEVWKSIDGGVTWTQQSGVTGLPALSSAAGCHIGGKFYIFGGYDGSSSRPEIWVSENGITWTQQTDGIDINWSGRYLPSICSTPDGKFLIIGGSDGTTWFSEIYEVSV